MSDSKVRAGYDVSSGKEVKRVGSKLPMEAKTQEELDAQVAEQKRREAEAAKPRGGGLAAAAAKNKARMNPVSEALKKTSEKK